MRILDEFDNELSNPNLKEGYLEEEEINIAYHGPVESVEGEGHYESVAKYDNGGEDVLWVWDIPPVEGREGYWEKENIYRYYKLSDEELKKIEEEKKRLIAEEEIARALLTSQINSLEVDDATAYRWRYFYPEWVEGKEYNIIDEKFLYEGLLYKVRSSHTSRETWLPGSTGTESLYERIDETHAGTLEDPIPYDGNMSLENGKYYSQDGITYLCTRDTGTAVYNALKDLVGLYVEAV